MCYPAVFYLAISKVLPSLRLLLLRRYCIFANLMSYLPEGTRALIKSMVNLELFCGKILVLGLLASVR